MLAPIVLFVYNRRDHVQKLINSLKNNSLAYESELYIFSDGYKDELDKKKVEEVRSYLHELEGQDFFRNVVVEYSEKNRGLAQSVIAGVTEIINRFGKVIVLEDDLIVSPHFLKFMNEGLDYYEKDNRIWSVSGFSRDIEYLRTIEEDMYFSCRAQSWSWATWKDRWDKTDWNVSDYSTFKTDFKKRAAFNAGGDDMSSMLDRQQCGKINSWAIRFCYAQFINVAYTVQPRVTLVQNGGQDGSGTHCNYVRESAELSLKSAWKFREFNMDLEINKQLKKTRKKIPKWKLFGSYIVFCLMRS